MITLFHHGPATHVALHNSPPCSSTLIKKHSRRMRAHKSAATHSIIQYCKDSSFLLNCLDMYKVIYTVCYLLRTLLLRNMKITIRICMYDLFICGLYLWCTCYLFKNKIVSIIWLLTFLGSYCSYWVVLVIFGKINTKHALFRVYLRRCLKFISGHSVQITCIMNENDLGGDHCSEFGTIFKEWVVQ